MKRKRFAEVAITTKYFFLIVFFVGCSGMVSSEQKGDQYLKVVETIIECDKQFFTEFVRARDRESVNRLVSCLQKVTANFDDLMKELNQLQPLDVTESKKYVDLLSNQDWDFPDKANNQLDESIGKEILDSYEKYMSKRIAVMEKFGIFLKE